MTDGSTITDAEARDWQAREFPTLQRVLHLANCSHAPLSNRVRHALTRYADDWNARGMDWDGWVAEVDAAKAAFAKLIHARPEDIAVAASASQAAASIASAFDWTGRRNRLVTTDAEFPTVGQVWVAFARYGIEVDFVPVVDGRISPEAYADHLDDRVQLVSATHVSYHNAFRQDVGRIARLAHAHGAMVVVDAYQSLGAVDVDAPALDVDLLIGGNLKYLLGIPGIAFVYAKPRIVEQLRPAVTGWFGRVDPMSFDPHTVDYASTAARLEMGTPPVAAAMAAAAGMSIILEAGPVRIEDRLRALSAFAIECAATLGLEYAGPDLAEKGAATAIAVPDPAAVESRLRDQGIIVSARRNVVRVAPHFFTTQDDLERGLTAIKHAI